MGQARCGTGNSSARPLRTSAPGGRSCRTPVRRRDSTRSTGSGPACSLRDLDRAVVNQVSGLIESIEQASWAMLKRSGPTRRSASCPGNNSFGYWRDSAKKRTSWLSRNASAQQGRVVRDAAAKRVGQADQRDLQRFRSVTRRPGQSSRILLDRVAPVGRPPALLLVTSSSPSSPIEKNCIPTTIISTQRQRRPVVDVPDCRSGCPA